MIYLPDVNVWIAFASDKHAHHAIAKSWFQSLIADQVAFCRITELGFLRLVTNKHVMGSDVLNAIAAWRIYDELRADPRVLFLGEPAGFSEHWRRAGNQIVGGPNAWTDAYLAALASHTGTTVATFDKHFATTGNCTVYALQ